MADKYRCYGKDGFGHPYDALSMKDEYGEWVRAEDYDATAADLAGLRREHQRVWEEKKALEASLWDLIDMVGRYPHPTESAKLTKARRLVLGGMSDEHG